MVTRRRAIVALAVLVIGGVIPLGCSSFGADAATDAGSTSSGEGGGTATDASIDQKEQQPDGSVPELCIGGECRPICGPGETTSIFAVVLVASVILSKVLLAKKPLPQLPRCSRYPIRRLARSIATAAARARE